MCKSSFWHVAQLVELLTVNQAVAGSSPAVPANRSARTENLGGVGSNPIYDM